MEAFINLITGFGVLAILFVIYAESGLLIGFMFPGDSLLFTAGYMVHSEILAAPFGMPFNIHIFVLLLFVAAVLGDSTGYAFGRKVGRKLFLRKNSRFFKRDHLLQAEKFYEKHGSLTIVLARFVPIIRTFAPIVAGASKMNYRTFITFNLAGGLLWVALFSYLGYYAGQALTDMGFNIEIIALIIILLSVSPMIIHGLKNPQNRAALKKQIEILLSKTKRRKKKK